MQARTSSHPRDGWPRALGGGLLLATFVFAQVVGAQALPPEASTAGEVTMLTDNPNSGDPELVPDGTMIDAPVEAPATLAGQVLIGPTCPVVRLDRLDQCRDQPYAATLSIQTADAAREVIQIAADEQGRFSIALDQGTYRIVPLSSPGHILPRGILQTVTVVSGILSTVVVHYDSGMR